MGRWLVALGMLSLAARAVPAGPTAPEKCAAVKVKAAGRDVSLRVRVADGGLQSAGAPGCPDGMHFCARPREAAGRWAAGGAGASDAGFSCVTTIDRHHRRAPAGDEECFGATFAASQVDDDGAT